MRVLLTRHGQTDWNIAGRYQGQSDVPLNQAGQLQAEQIAQRLSRETIHSIYTSDLSRASDTAQKIADMQKVVPVIQRDTRWRELSFGDWEGMTFKEMSAHSPDLFSQWMIDPKTISTPNGETLVQLAERVKSAFDEIKNNHLDQTILVVAHSGSLQTLLASILGVDLNRYWQFRISQASLSELNVIENSASLHLLNETTHLQGK
ncbi:MAG: alpha-ribazole phosphatase [Anaerolineales bacterium]